jgi:hypothetical protein
MKTLDADGYRGPTTWNLGSFGQVRRRSCPFCELVTSTCSGSRFSWDKPTPPNDSVSIDLRWGNYGFATNQSPLGSYICIASQDPETERYYARARLPEWIDFDDVLGWISSCEQDHPRNGDYECSPGAYNLAVLPRNNRRQLDFRLIDVESLCIVYAPRECKYVALSYVWGQSKKKRLVLTSKNEEALMEPRALDDVQTRGSIPNTIWDAMSVVRKLGERYLWVDSLCLLQDDRDELQDCVSIMDLFYDMALLTIVAGSGEDAWSGLPGVAPTARGIKPFIRFIKHGLTMTSIMGVDLLLRQSVYSSRAWT